MSLRYVLPALDLLKIPREIIDKIIYIIIDKMMKIIMNFFKKRIIKNIETRWEFVGDGSIFRIRVYFMDELIYSRDIDI